MKTQIKTDLPAQCFWSATRQITYQGACGGEKRRDNLSGADQPVQRADLYGANLSRCQPVDGANLSRPADLSGADLSEPTCPRADLYAELATCCSNSAFFPDGDLIGWKNAKTA